MFPRFCSLALAMLFGGALYGQAPFIFPSATVGVPWQFAPGSFGAIEQFPGAVPPYTACTITSGAIPPGFTFSPFTFANGQNNCYFRGTPTTAGTFNYTFTLTDSASATSGVGARQITVNGPVNITTSTLPNVTMPAAYPSTTLVATGGTAPLTWSISTGALPSGLTLSSAGVISGTPTAAGVFNFGVRVQDVQAASAIKTFSITVTASLQISASPTALTFTGKTDGPSSSSLINVSATAVGQPFTFATSTVTGGNWLSATSPVRTTPGSVQVTANPAGLAAGTYQGSVTINNPNSNPPTVTVAVTFTVQASATPQLRVSPASLSVAAVVGGAAATRTVAVTNPGSGSIPVTVTARTNGGNWLSATPGSGNVTPNAPLSVTITADPRGLSSGTFNGTVTIAGSGMTVQVSVTLSVSDLAQKISLSQGGLTFFGVAGLAPSEPQSINVSNTGSGNLSFSATATTVTGGNWLSVSPASGTAAAGGNGTDLQVIADPSRLTAGDYYGKINVAGSGAANTPQSASIVLRVAAPGTALGIKSAPSAAVFLAAGTQTLTISTDGAGSFATSVTDDFAGGPSFFSHSPAAGGTITAGSPLKLNVTTVATGLSPGIYSGSLVLQTNTGVILRVPVILSIPLPSTEAEPAGAALTGAGRAATCAPTKLLPVATSFSDNFSVAAGWPTPIEVRVVDDCASLFSAGSVVVSFSNGDVPISLSQLGDGRWTGTWSGRSPANSVVITVTAATKDQSLTGKAVFGGALQVNPNPPMVSEGGVVNGASFLPQVSPGSFVSVFGSRLAQAQVSAPTVPLPLVLSGASIVAAGREVPLFFTIDGQLNAILPYGIPVNTLLQVITSRENALSTPQTVSVSAAAPGIFAYGNNLGIVQGVQASGAVPLANKDNPVQAGQTVVIYCTGLGEVNPPVPAGTQTPLTQLSNTVATVTLTIGGVPATVSFAGLTPGQTGLYQVNAVVPSGVAAGDSVPVVMTAAGQSSAPVFISVR